MTSFPRIFLLLASAVIPLINGQDASPVSQGIAEMREMEQQTERTENELAESEKLPEVPFNPHSEMPKALPGTTAVVADSGMYFDNLRSCLIYVGNVRLNNERLQLRAARRLYLLLPEKEKEAAAKDISTDKPAGKKPATAERTAPAAPHPAPSNPAKPPAPPEPPMLIVAENAAVDEPGSKALLEGLRREPSLTIHRGEDLLILHEQEDGEPAWAYAAPSGNVLFLGARVVGKFTRDGEHYELTAQRGPLFYNAATRTLTIDGPATLTSSSERISSDEQMCITFAPGKQPASGKKGSFAQFTGMRLGPMQRLAARGHVVCDRAAKEGQPESHATGDILTYNAATGASRIEGTACSLIYGKQTLRTSGVINLEPSGNASVSGDVITGVYERPAPRGAKPAFITGTYTTKGTLLYDAAENKVTFPAGLQARDSLTRFSCTGQTIVYLQRAVQPPPARKEGMPNMTVAHQQGVLRFTARGNVKLHSAATSEQQEIEASCDELSAHVIRGTAHLHSVDGTVSHVRYGGYLLDAQSDKLRGGDVTVDENGDIKATGTRLHAQLPGKEGMADIRCTQLIHLARVRRLLTLGPDSTINSPNGILTAHGKLDAELTEDPEPHPLPHKYPHLHYPYSGLRQASTEQGGSLRTVKMSMQCDGPMFIRLLPGKPNDDFRENIDQATAYKNVRIAGKDAEGKLRRADGESLFFNHKSGNIYLRGARVTLMDADNTHTASGRDACITIDPKDNAHVTGEHQTTAASHFRRQVDSHKKKSQKKK